ncbi:MAG: carbohydrate binding domain-containing protein, partial [Candidatus Saccharimonadales bacterium]|nr:carbohydrate binding domain-containing protein [Candidatus Saccharimonadales bacterium]
MHKSLAAILAVFLVLPISLFSGINAQDEAQPNLIANPSAEILNSNNQPEGWTFNQWGDLSAIGATTTDASDGSVGMYVAVTDRSSGDAKWYFDKVSVEPSTKYEFTDYYKASAPSETVIQFTANDGGVSYKWLGTNPARDDWTQSSYQFTTLSDTAQLSVFHVMAQNGELWVDDYSLALPTALPQGQFANSDLETTDPNNSNQPRYWTPQHWGDNTANFSYLNSGYGDDRSVKVEITRYSSGDAKWYPDFINLTPGQDYRFSNMYKSNIDSRFVVAIKAADGSMSYSELQTAPASPNSWSSYADAFTVPSY